MKPVFLASTLLFALAACGQAPSDVVPEGTDLGKAPPAAASDKSAVTAIESNGGDVLTITPIKTDNCTPRSYTAKVSWDIPRGQVPPAGVQVRVNRPDGGLLAFKKGATSSAVSGNWVKPGTTFYLIDAKSKQVLAKATSNGFNCK